MRWYYWFIIVLASSVLGYGVTKRVINSLTPSPTPTPEATASATPEPDLSPIPTLSSGCDPTLWDHIYHPSRLQVIEPCKTVEGVVEVIRVEKDGDYHILLRLDSAYANLINQVNTDKQHGDLVIEPICENPVTQADAISACQGFSQDFKLTVGEHIRVTGAYVTDLQHGWNEIHPITSVEVL